MSAGAALYHKDHHDEQLNIGDDVSEGMDDDVDEAEPIEDKSTKGQEGLDLDMVEEDTMAFADEPDAEHEVGLLNDDTERDRMATAGTEPEQVGLKGNIVERGADDPKGLLLQPPHGSEVFVGGISKDTVEGDLKDLCSPCGDIFEICILRDKDTGKNTGSAFVMFTNRENAEKAIETLNASELKGRKLRFSQAQRKHSLFISNIPREWEKEDFKKALENQGPGVEGIELLKDPQNPCKNRGCAFINYYNHACAENAKENMSTTNFKLGSETVRVSWVDSRSSADNAAMSQVKVVYVSNLPDGVTQECLQKLFERHGEISRVVLPGVKPGETRRDFGFVYFNERSGALRAVEESEKYELEGRVLEVSLAKPHPGKKPPGNAHSTHWAGLLPPSPGMLGYGCSDAALFRGGPRSDGFRGYSQPVIYGRGAVPPGMMFARIILPDGRVGYVLKPSGAQSGPAPFRFGGIGSSDTGCRQSGRNVAAGSGSSHYRYHPY